MLIAKKSYTREQLWPVGVYKASITKAMLVTDRGSSVVKEDTAIVEFCGVNALLLLRGGVICVTVCIMVISVKITVVNKSTKILS